MEKGIQRYSRKVFLIPPYYLAFCLVLSFVVARVFPDAALGLSPLNQIAGLLLIGLGCCLVLTALVFLRKHKTTELFKKSTCVVVTGPFQFSRNPIYLGFTFFLIGVAFSLGNSVSLVSPLLYFCILNWSFIPYEEEKMAIELGQDYFVYKKRVRRWI